METEAAGMGWDGYSVYTDERGWGSVSVPVQTSSATLLWPEYLLDTWQQAAESSLKLRPNLSITDCILR